MISLSDSIRYAGALVLLVSLAACGRSDSSDSGRGASNDQRQASGSTRPELKPKWPDGETVRYSINKVRKLEIGSPFRSELQQRSLSQRREVEVTPLQDDGSARVGVELVSLSIEREGGGRVESFDSAAAGEGSSEGDPKLATIFGSLIGKQVIAHGGSDGRLSRVEIGDTVETATRKASDYWREVAEALFDTENLSFCLTPLQARTNRIATGLEWEQALPRSYGRIGRLRGVGNYRIEEWAPDGESTPAVLSYDGRLEPVESSSNKEGGYALKQGTIKGTVRFDPYRGRLVSSEWKEEMTFDRKLPMPPSSSGNGGGKQPTSTVRVSQEVTVELR